MDTFITTYINYKYWTTFLYTICMLKYKYYHNHHILKSLVIAYFWPVKLLYMIDHALIHIGKNLKFMLGNNQIIEFYFISCSLFSYQVNKILDFSITKQYHDCYCQSFPSLLTPL